MTRTSRRAAITASLTCLLAPQPWSAVFATAEARDGTTSAPTASEDLMREHGVLNRLMLVYEAALSPPAAALGSIHEVLHGTASLIRSFIEDYHGELEEKYLFPEFDRQHSHSGLVTTLRQQHQIGRALTSVILRHATEDGLSSNATRAEITRACRDFIRMFRAHEAWEDTELFPAFRGLVSPERLQDLGDEFEDIEHRKFGKDGFATIVRKVEQLEHHVGIHRLDSFTAPAPGRVTP